MNRKSTSPKPEIPMSQDGRMSEVMRAIMPYYPKWNRLFFQLGCVFAIINFVLACILLAGWADAAGGHGQGRRHRHPQREL